jgi:hypothetical protein
MVVDHGYRLGILKINFQFCCYSIIVHTYIHTSIVSIAGTFVALY